MAPDLNSINQQVDYATLGSGGYLVPDTVFRDPSARPLRIITIGAGISGIFNAYTIQKEFLQAPLPHNPEKGPAPSPSIQHVVYEKNTDIGGTWLENRYPGCACDVPSHAYAFNFALNPDWPQFFSYSPDIWAYLDKVCEVFDLRKYMQFNTEVEGCTWDDDKGEWRIKLRKWQNGRSEVFEDHCHLLLHATGVLNNFKWPDIPGLKDKFKGRILHTARWDSAYNEQEWKNDRIAVIGSGASSIQTVPTMQKVAKHIDVFIRTPVWFVEIAGNRGSNEKYDEDLRSSLRNDPAELVAKAKSLEDKINSGWGAFYSNTKMQAAGQELCKNRMAELIKDERIRENITPKWAPGCRRVTPGDPYLAAIQKENVDVHFTAVASCTEKGVVGEDGVEREVDTIICATGFDVSFCPRFPIVGKGGVDLRDKWKSAPEGYMGLGSPDMPNFITYIGPSWPIENGSVMGPLKGVCDYTMQVIRKMQQDHIKSWTPRQDITDQFNTHVQEWIKHTVWKEECRSWYKDHTTGRVNAIWPGSSLHYMQAIQHVRWEDFDIEYQHSNPFACLGMGWTLENKAGLGFADASPYMSVNQIDPQWIEAMKMPPKRSINGGSDERPSMLVDKRE